MQGYDARLWYKAMMQGFDARLWCTSGSINISLMLMCIGITTPQHYCNMNILKKLNILSIILCQSNQVRAMSEWFEVFWKFPLTSISLLVDTRTGMKNRCCDLFLSWFAFDSHSRWTNKITEWRGSNAKNTYEPFEYSKQFMW